MTALKNVKNTLYLCKNKKICQFTAPDASFVASLKTPEKFIGIIKKYTKICRLLLMYALKFNMYLFYI